MKLVEWLKTRYTQQSGLSKATIDLTLNDILSEVESVYGPKSKEELKLKVNELFSSVVKNKIDIFSDALLKADSMSFSSKTEKIIFDAKLKEGIQGLSDFLIKLSKSDIKAPESYHKPTFKGQIHPTRGYIADHWKGRLTWFSSPEAQSKHDKHINDPQKIDNFLSTIKSPDHRAAMHSVIKMIQKDPHRHVIETAKGIHNPSAHPSHHELRARNIKDLLFGGEGYIINTNDPDLLTITKLERHGTRNKPTSYHFNIIRKGEDYVRSFEENDRRRNLQSSSELFRSHGDFRKRGSGLHQAENWSHVRESSQDASFSSRDSRRYSYREEKLNKAVHPKDWKRIENSHDNDASILVDHNFHANSVRPHEHFTKLLSDKKVFSAVKDLNNGISAKMIHPATGYTDADDKWTSYDKPSVFMSKPYHKKIESATKSYVKSPITGWATMATKGLFNAAGIGHLAEDVSTHVHNGIPLTVHRFGDNVTTMESMPDLKQKNMDPLQLHQIATLDYLANNLDRHVGNIAISNDKNDDGYHNLLAIDHERSFQYHKNLQDHFRNAKRIGRPLLEENPQSYIEGSALNRLHQNFDGWHHLSSWWKSNGHKIREEFTKHLEQLKDQEVREHISKNFTHRWNAMNEWAHSIDESQDHWNPDGIKDYFPKIKNIPMQLPRVTEKYLKTSVANMKLKDSLSFFSDIINKRERLSPSQSQYLANAMRSAVNKASPEEIKEALAYSLENPNMNTEKIRKLGSHGLIPRNVILDQLRNPIKWEAGNNPVYKADHINAAVDYINSLPEDKREILGYWGQSLKSLIGG